MAPIKTLLTGLFGVSLCMADISGIVTDTGTTPLAGAVVRLEKGGQTATTGADGSFTLFTSTAVLPGNSRTLPNGLSARISGTILTFKLVEQSAVEVATFELNGKSVSTVRRTMDAGRHSMALPQRGTGVYLYEVKSGNSEFVLKGNAIGGASSGSALSSHRSAPNHVAKQAMMADVFNDVIAATKTGYLNYRMAIGNPDTNAVVIKMIASAGTITDADGNVYQTVKIGSQEWMAENLRTTKYNDGSPISNITGDSAWDSCEYTQTGAYCYYDNTTDSDSIKKYGALYNWYAVNTGKLAPSGWHVPTDSEWTVLENYLIANGYNYDGTTTGNKIAKSMAAKTDWAASEVEGTIGNDLNTNNRSGFSALPGGLRNFHGDGVFLNQSVSGSWWSATEFALSSALHHDLCCEWENLDLWYSSNSIGFSVRLLRD